MKWKGDVSKLVQEANIQADKLWQTQGKKRVRKFRAIINRAFINGPYQLEQKGAGLAELGRIKTEEEV